MSDSTIDPKNGIAKLGDLPISAGTLIDYLIIQNNFSAVSSCLDQILIERLLQQSKLEPTNEELQHEIRLFRQRNGLLTGDETRQWLQSNHMNDSHLVHLCRYEAGLKKLKAALFAKKIEEQFLYRRQELTCVEFYKIAVTSIEQAREIVSSVREGESFFEYARKYSIEPETAKVCGYAGRVKLSTLLPQVQEALCGCLPGDVIGPIKVLRNFEIFLFEKMHVPMLDQEMRAAIEDELFQSWLADFRAKAHVEWLI